MFIHFHHHHWFIFLASYSQQVDKQEADLHEKRWPVNIWESWIGLEKVDYVHTNASSTLPVVKLPVSSETLWVHLKTLEKED